MSSIPGNSVDESRDRNQTIVTHKIAIVIRIVTEKKISIWFLKDFKNTSLKNTTYILVDKEINCNNLIKR